MANCVKTGVQNKTKFLIIYIGHLQLYIRYALYSGATNVVKGECLDSIKKTKDYPETIRTYSLTTWVDNLEVHEFKF